MTFNESMKRIREQLNKQKELDNKMDAILNRTISADRFDNWHFEHNEFDCPKCEQKLNLYLGEHNNLDAHKYECSNLKCTYNELIYIKDMEKES